MPALEGGQVPSSQAVRASQGLVQSGLPRLPLDVWQQIARAALAAEDGDLRAWARLSAVCPQWRPAVRYAVVDADSPPVAGDVSGGSHPQHCSDAARLEAIWTLHPPHLRLRPVCFACHDLSDSRRVLAQCCEQQTRTRPAP